MTPPWPMIALLAAGFVVGAIPASLLALQKVLGDHLHAEPVDVAAWMRRYFMVPAIFCLPIAGALADRWTPREVALLGVFFAIVGIGLLALVPRTPNAFLNLMGVSAGLSLLAVGTIAWMPSTLALAGREVEAMNLGFAAFGLGWLVGPFLAMAASHGVGVSRTLLLHAAALLVIFGLLAFVPSDAEAVAVRRVPMVDFAGDLRFWLVGFVLLLYAPIAGAVDVWSRPFVRELADDSDRGVDLRLLIFWLMFLMARVLAFFAMRTGLEPWVLLACAVVSVIVVGNLAGAQQLSSGSFGFWAVGFCYGPLLPGMLGLLAADNPHLGLIVGSILGTGTLFHLGANPLLTRAFEGGSPRRTMRASMLTMLGLSSLLLLVALMQPEPPSAPRPFREPVKREVLKNIWRAIFQRRG